MNLYELKQEIDKWINEGYGEKNIYLDAFNGEQGKNYEIDSIQQNTNPGLEPDYLFIMNGDESIN